jgi:cytochrome c-type biogenesis protein CcmH
LNGLIYAGGAGLTLLALLFVIVPLLKYRKEGAVGIVLPVLIVAFPVAVYTIYSSVTSYEEQAGTSVAQTSGSEPPVDELVSNLAERMRLEPTVDGLSMLGITYLRLQRYADAADAWRRAWEITDGKDVDVSISYAEALILANRDTLKTSAVDLLEFALSERPDDSRANWYGGLSAAARGQNDLAVKRWTVVLNDPQMPADARMALQQQLASMGGAAPAAAGTVISATVSISPELAQQDTANRYLFLIARDVNQPRPPLAVRRVSVGSFPQSLEFGDANLMVPGRSLADVRELEVIARISQSGDPIAASGDLYGEAIPAADDNGNLKADILIDSVVD